MTYNIKSFSVTPLQTSDRWQTA